MLKCFDWYELENPEPQRTITLEHMFDPNEDPDIYWHPCVVVLTTMGIPFNDANAAFWDAVWHKPQEPT